MYLHINLKCMRVAVKIAYIGTDFHGFHVQPSARTIEGELFRSLAESGIINNPHEAGYISAGRTDQGVHALGQVIAFDTETSELAIPGLINSKLPPTIWAWASAYVPEGFDPRHNAISREYRYIMCGKYSISLLRNASRLLKGTHDFANFSTQDKEKGSICNIEKIETRIEGEFTIMDVQADHFLWHMVRKIATALPRVGGVLFARIDVKHKDARAQFQLGLEPSPAYG